MVDTVKCHVWQFGMKMNCKQARAKLDSVSKSTSTKHPKILVAELCAVVKFLLDELDLIKSSSVFPLKITWSNKQVLPEDFEVKRSPNIQPPWPDRPIKSPSINPPHPYRKGNAGDAE